MAVIDDRPIQSFALDLAVGEGTAPPVDAEVLAAPVSPERPCGELLRYEGTYVRLEEARRSDDPSLPQGVWQTALKTADWLAVIELAGEVLARRSKDAQIAAWLTEALAHRHGFSGVAAGLETLALLCETFWDGLHPVIEDDGDADARCAPFSWLDDKLTRVVERLPLVQPDDGPAFSLSDREAAQRNDRQGKPKPQAAKKAPAIPVTTERLAATLSLTPSAHLAACRDGARAALAALARIDAVLDAGLGRDAPGLANLRAVLGEAERFANRELQHRGDSVDASDTAAAADDAATAEAPPTAAAAGGSAFGPITSREQAYRQLTDAAHYLQRTEPHSPVPYLVLRAVRWGSMPLGELLVELVRTDSDLRATFDLLGMPGPMGKK
ncbi:type VI secretion system protein TssA [Novispirillum sp. DQ9]|uniref:type VI secretion system protein TssA n=1 Tax=Novispirillum sp. DQ9 TaxID=3398612 RepID=UPI003C7B1D1B